MGDGQFDRFSAARRTRRYKKNTEEDTNSRKDTPAGASITELISNKQMVRPNTLQVQSVPLQKLEPHDTESRLKRWQNKVQYKDPEEDAIMDITRTGEELKNLKRSATLPRSQKFPLMNRKIGEGIYKAVKNGDSVDGGNMTVSISSAATAKPNSLSPSQMSPEPTNVNIPHDLGYSSKVKSEFIPEIRVQVITPNKHRELDMRDEGFEESQSLVSETLSQETSSGNFEQENVSPTSKTATPKIYNGRGETTNNPLRPIALERNKPVTTSFRHETKPSVTPIKRSISLRRATPQTSGNVLKTNTHCTNQSNVLPPKNTQSSVKPLTRSNSVTKTQQPPLVKKTFPIEKSSSKTSLKSAPIRKKVERSNSKSSLQSSRSSLNSSSSVNTVRPANNTIPGIRKYTNEIRSLTENVHHSPPVSKSKTPVPASRSSSSGSSIGPTLRKTMKTAANSDLSTSSRALGRSSSSGSSFMRPTASSTAKDAPDPSLKKLKPKLRSFK